MDEERDAAPRCARATGWVQVRAGHTEAELFAPTMLVDVVVHVHRGLNKMPLKKVLACIQMILNGLLTFLLCKFGSSG